MSKKISQLTAVVTPLGTDQLEVNQGGTSKRATITQITSIEATARIAADTALSTSLSTETTNRTNADTALGVLIGNSINKNGSVTFTANQPLGGFKFTGLGAGTVATDSVRYGQVLLLSGVNAMTATLDMGTNKISNVIDPSSAQDAVTLLFLKKKDNWDTCSDSTVLPINTSVVLTPGTDKNKIIFGNDIVTGAKVITCATAPSGYDGKFTLVFDQIFTVAAGGSLTIKQNLTTIKVFYPGTHNPCIINVDSQGTTIVQGTNLDSNTGLGILTSPIPLIPTILSGYIDASAGIAIGATNVLDLTGTGTALVLPEGAIILHNQVVIETYTAFTSGGAATLAWGYTGTAAAFDAATGFGASPYTASNLVRFGSVVTVEKLTAAKTAIMTVAGAALTGGIALIHIPILINKF